MKKRISLFIILIFFTSVISMSTNAVQGQTRYSMDFWYSPSHYGSEEADVADLIASQLEDTGFFDVNIKSAEWSQYVEQFTTMGFFLLGWWFDYPDPSNYIDPFVGSGAFSLGTNYSDSTMDGYINTMLTNTDLNAREQAQKDAQNLMAEDVPVVPLFSMIKQFSGYQSSISGYNLEPSENVHYNTITDSSNDPQIVIGTTDSISKLDPADAYDYFSSNTLVQITHGLMEMPKDSTTAQLGPIASAVNVNAAATEYNFTLKEGIQFSDGTPFNATAMKWNIDRVLHLDNTTGTDPGFLLSSVVDSVEVYNETLLGFHLSSPDATFLQRLTYTVAWPVSPNSLSYDEVQGQPESIPAGLGPYKITSWTANNELILEPNTNYFGDAPANNKVVINFYSDASALLTALENNQVDIAQKQFGAAEINSIKDNSNLKFKEKATAGIRYLVINVEAHPDKNVRQAIAAAVDRSEITQTVFQGINSPLYSMVPDIFDSAIDAFSDGTAAQVSSLMNAAGYTGGTTEAAPFGTLATVVLTTISTAFVLNTLRRRKH